MYISKWCGPTNPPEEVADGASPFEMYLCFVDSAGELLFSVSMGEEMENYIPECAGHADLFATGSEDEPVDDATVLEARAAQGVVVKTMKLLKRYPFHPAFGAEQNILMAPHRFLKRLHKGRRHIASDKVIILDANGQPVANGTRLADLSSAVPLGGAAPLAWIRGQRHAVQANASYIHGLGSLAEHSATYTALHHETPAPFGTFRNVKHNCNHGRCPWEMPFKYLLFSEPRADTHVHNWYCQTTYNPTSIYGHNCNDDTVATTRSVRSNFHWDAYNGTPCNDPYIRRYAPGPWE